MKYIKILTMLLLPFIAIACDDDESYNSGAATVEFKSAEITLKEMTSAYDFPIVVTGEHTGLIKVSIALKDVEGGFEDDKNIIMTQHELLIPAGTETVNVETVLSLANEEITPNRHFSLEIVNAEGAAIGANAVCKVNIEENNPLEGMYSLVGYSLLQGSTGIEQIDCMLTMAEGSTDQMYLDFGLGDLAVINLEEIVAGKKYKMSIAANQKIGTHPSYGLVQLQHMMPVGNQWTSVTEAITGTFENKVVTFEGDHALGIYLPEAKGYFNLVGSYYDENDQPVPLRLIKQ
ncbi:hypothetical protein [Bacteroides sp.]